MNRYLFSSANILCGLLLITGCGDNNAGSTEQTTTSSGPGAVSASKKVASAKVDITSWSGEALGYVSRGNPATDNVAFLVHAGRIQSALNSYRDAGQRLTSLAQNNSATPEERELAKAIATASVGADLQESYKLIEPVLIKNKSKPYKEELANLAKAETISDLLDTAYEKDKQRGAVQKSVKLILSRLQTSINDVNPSIREVMLSASALIREAGDAMQKGLSATGNVIDRTQYEKGLALLIATRFTKPEYQVHY